MKSSTLFSCEDEDIGRFSNLHSCTFLINFMPLVCFYNSWKQQKNSGFLMFSGGYRKRPAALYGLTHFVQMFFVLQKCFWVGNWCLKWQNVFQKLKSKKHAINHEANTYFRNFLQITKRTSRGINSITAQCCFSIPPENIRKPLVSGGIQKQHQAVMD